MAECQEELSHEKMSDEDKTKSCDSCSFRDVYSAADKYCPVCVEYLCTSCEDTHRSFKATRAHELVQIGKSPGASVRMKKPATKVMICDIHHNESVTEFCETHSKVICRPCKLTKHRHCNTKDLRKAAKERQNSFKECFEDVEVLASEFEKIECSRQSDKMQILKISKDLKQDVKNIKQEIVFWANKLEEDALQQIDKTEHELVSNVNSHIAVLEEIKRQLRMAKASLEKLDDDCLVENFILVTKAQQQIQDGTEVKQEIEKEIKPLTFNFRKSDTLSRFQSEISSFGSIETEESCSIDFQETSSLKKSLKKKINK